MNLPNKLTVLRVIMIPFFVAALMAEGGLFRHMVELQSESAQWQLSGARP